MSLNDPQWGRKGGGNGGGESGPPDLDEMWRNFNKRLGGLFGGKGGGNEGGSPGGFRQLGGFGLLAILVLAGYMFTGFYTVDESERALVLTFGKNTDMTGPGFHWRMPYPFQRHEVVNITQSRNLEIGSRTKSKAARDRESLMLTRDENIIDIQFSVVYTHSEPVEYQFNLRQKDDAVIMQVAESAMREIVGKSSMDFVLSEGREQIAEQAKKLIQDILNQYKAGVTISSVQLLNAQPPEQVQAAFDDAVKAKQDLERQKNEGQAYYNDVVPKAEGTASRLIEEANGYKERVVANAEGEAARFKQVLTEYSKAPGVTRERMYLDAMQQVLSHTSKVITDTRAGNNLLFLPLDKLMQMSASGAPETPAMTRPAPQQPEASPPASASAAEVLRSRDALRTRERDSR